MLKNEKYRSTHFDMKIIFFGFGQENNTEPGPANAQGWTISMVLSNIQAGSLSFVLFV